MDADCGAGRACTSGVCVGTGELRFTLRWHENSDVDLHVMTPNGVELSFLNTRADNGELDVDDISGGPDSVENVFFVSPPRGTYTFWAVNFSGREVINFALEAVSNGAVLASHNGTITNTSRAETTRYVVTFP